MPELNGDDIGSVTPGHYGAVGVGAGAEVGVTLAPVAIAAAWNVQGNAAESAPIARTLQLFDGPLPLDANTTRRGKQLVALWMGPRSWLLVEGSPSGKPSLLTDFSVRRDAVNALGGALFDVSASRVAYRIGGTHAASVLAKSCPLDFSDAAGGFPAGGCAQSVFGRVNALIFREDSASEFVMLVARSFARDVWSLLCRSSAQYGYAVLAPQPIVGAR